MQFHIGLSPTIYDKYTNEFENKCYNLLSMYNITYVKKV